jgi:hypothetical protein
MGKSGSSLEKTIEQTAHGKCKVQVADYILFEQRNLFEKIKSLHRKIEEEPSLLKRKAHINELYFLRGESEALRKLADRLVSLAHDDRLEQPPVATSQA